MDCMLHDYFAVGIKNVVTGLQKRRGFVKCVQAIAKKTKSRYNIQQRLGVCVLQLQLHKITFKF